MYIIRGDYKSGFTYYVDTYYHEHKPINVFTFDLENAQRISNYELAEMLLKDINDPNFKILNVCPMCRSPYTEYPSISRRDNKTKICPTCGMKEAISNYLNNQKSLV